MHTRRTVQSPPRHQPVIYSSELGERASRTDVKQRPSPANPRPSFFIRVHLRSVISVITPVFNGERFIESCIRNFIDQRCEQAEHIIVDGGSRDRTVEIVRRYAEQHAHIRWL